MPRIFPLTNNNNNLRGATDTAQILIDHRGGAAGIKQTLDMMAGLKHKYKTDSEIRELALNLTGDLNQKDYAGECYACWEFVKNSIRYVRDVAGVETIQTPVKTLEYGSGDCDDKSVLLASLLESIGHPCRFLAVGINNGGYCHVLVETFRDNKWIPLETTEPEEIGWLPKNITKVMRDSKDGRAQGIAPPNLGNFEYSYGGSAGKEKINKFAKLQRIEDAKENAKVSVYSAEAEKWRDEFLKEWGLDEKLLDIPYSIDLTKSMFGGDIADSIAYAVYADSLNKGIRKRGSDKPDTKLRVPTVYGIAGTRAGKQVAGIEFASIRLDDARRLRDEMAQNAVRLARGQKPFNIKTIDKRAGIGLVIALTAVAFILLSR